MEMAHPAKMKAISAGKKKPPHLRFESLSSKRSEISVASDLYLSWMSPCFPVNDGPYFIAGKALAR